MTFTNNQLFEILLNCDSAEELKIKCAVIGIDSRSLVQTVYKIANNIWKFSKQAKCPTAEELYKAKKNLPIEKHMMANTRDPCQAMLYLMREELLGA